MAAHVCRMPHTIGPDASACSRPAWRAVTWCLGLAAGIAAAAPPGGQPASPPPAIRRPLVARPGPPAPCPPQAQQQGPTSCCLRRLLTVSSFFTRAIFTLRGAHGGLCVVPGPDPRLSAALMAAGRPARGLYPKKSPARPVPALLAASTGLSRGADDRVVTPWLHQDPAHRTRVGRGPQWDDGAHPGGAESQRHPLLPPCLSENLLGMTRAPVGWPLTASPMGPQPFPHSTCVPGAPQGGAHPGWTLLGSSWDRGRARPHDSTHLGPSTEPTAAAADRSRFLSPRVRHPTHADSPEPPTARSRPQPTSHAPPQAPPASLVPAAPAPAAGAPAALPAGPGPAGSPPQRPPACRRTPGGAPGTGGCAPRPAAHSPGGAGRP